MATPVSEAKDLDLEWRSADPVASEILFRDQLATLRQDPRPENMSREIELLCMIGRSETSQQKLVEALATLEEAEKLLTANSAGYKVSAQIRWLLERGRLFIQQNTPSRARPLFSQAWILAVNSGEDFFTVDIARMMAVIEPIKAQEEWILKGIQVAEQSPQEKPKRWLGGLFSTLAWKQFDLRQYEKAHENLQRSLSYFRKFGTDREVFVARWSVGRVLRQMERTEEALTIQRALHAELGPSATPDGRLYEELAECLLELKQSDEAVHYFALAFQELSKEQKVADNMPLKLKRLKTMGKVT